jgi:Mor family transcriptional regulator
MDILHDIEARMIGAGVDGDTIRRILSEVRRDWAGENTYIARHGEDPRVIISRRNLALLRDWQRGERVPYLARKYGISVKTVYRIIRGHIVRREKNSHRFLSDETPAVIKAHHDHDPDV